MTFFDANYRITDFRTENGKIVDLEKDVGDYLLNKIRYKEQDYIRSSEDDIRI